MNELIFSQELYPSRVNQKDIYMSPLFVLDRFKSIMEKYGTERVLKESKFKKAREIWAGATFLLGLTKATNKKYWLKPEYIDEPPDIYVTTTLPHPEKDGNQKIDFSVEIMDWDWHSGDTLLNAITKKLKNVRYPEGYTLLIYGKQKPDLLVNMEKIFIKLSKKKININDIWILLPVKNVPDCDHHICCLYPKRSNCNFSFQKEKESINNVSQEEIIYFFRKKGTDDLPGEEIKLKLPDL